MTGRAPWHPWAEHRWPVAPPALADLSLGVLAALVWRDDPLAFGLLALPLLVHALALRAHGHQVGDALLVAAVGALRGMVRAEDAPARYGGNEFAVILREATRDEALAVAERVRAAVALGREGTTICTNVSVGLTVVPAHARTRAGLIRAADGAAHAATYGGKGRVRVADRMAAAASDPPP